MVMFFGLKWIPIHQLTQNFGFNIPFHPYIHDQDLEQAFDILLFGENMYVSPILAYGCILWFSVTLFWLK